MLVNFKFFLFLYRVEKLITRNDSRNENKRKNKESEKRKNISDEISTTKRLKESVFLDEKCLKSKHNDDIKFRRDKSESNLKEEHRKRIHENRSIDNNSYRKRSHSPNGM